MTTAEPVSITYGVIPAAKGGFLPYYQETGRTHFIWAAGGLDRDDALAQARGMAEEQAGRYLGDFRVTVAEGPDLTLPRCQYTGGAVSVCRKGVQGVGVMSYHPSVDAWMRWKIREARYVAAATGRSVESALLRSQGYWVREIQRLLPILGTFPWLMQDTIYLFDQLPEAEKQPIKEPEYPGHMKDWVRTRLNAERTRAEVEGWEYPGLALSPELLDEAQGLFPEGDVVGLIFEHAARGCLDPTPARVRNTVSWIRRRGESAHLIQGVEGQMAADVFLKESPDAFVREVHDQPPTDLVTLVDAAWQRAHEVERAEDEHRAAETMKRVMRSRLDEMRKRRQQAAEELCRKIEEAPGNVGAWWREKLQEMKSE